MRGVSTPQSGTLLATCGPLITLYVAYDIDLSEIAIRACQANQCGIWLGILQAFLAFKIPQRIYHRCSLIWCYLQGHILQLPMFSSANDTKELAMVVASGCKNWCLHKGDLHCAYSLRC